MCALGTKTPHVFNEHSGPISAYNYSGQSDQISHNTDGIKILGTTCCQPK